MSFKPDLPYNDLPLLPPTCNLDDVVILKAVNRANKALARLNGASLAVPNRAFLLEPLTVREAVASSGIENINTTVSEVFQAELFPIEEAPKAQKETLHYKQALLHGHQYLKSKGFLATNAIIDIQSILEPEKPGIRRLPGTKIADQLSGQIFYTPPEGEEHIRRLLKNFDDYYNAREGDIDPLIWNAVLHYQFEAIHPFYDGNGRTGRILMVLHLVLSGGLDLPILFLSGYINQNRSLYYQLLRAVSAENAWKPWILYILQAVETQALSTAATIEAILSLQRKLEETLRTVRPALPVKELSEYLVSTPFYSRQRLAQKLDKHPNSALKYLNTLEEEGLLRSFSLKREKVFVLDSFLGLL